MAISVKWGTGVITVNQTDPELTFVSGDTYELDTNAFRLALKALEEGQPFVRTNKHNTIVTIDGINYVRSFEIINGYTVQFLPNSPWRVRMDGASNNNIHSEGILIQNQVQVIPSNSAGNTVTETGTSGLTPQESQALLDIDANVAQIQIDIGQINTDLASQLALLTGINARSLGEHITSSDTGILTITNYTESRRWQAQAYEDSLKSQVYRGSGMEAVDELVEVAYP